MAVHLRMDFRILELSRSLHVLQCERNADIPCPHEVEYNPRQPGALARAIHQLRLHTCQNEAAPGTGERKSPVAFMARRPITATR